MRYLEKFKSFENVSVINSYIQDINDILLELSDYNWVILVDYVPKRWENPSANYTIKSDYIGVVIKKKQNKSQSRYPEGSEFKFSDVSDYIHRIVDYFMTNDYRIRICELNNAWYNGMPGHSEKGIWSDWTDSEMPELDKNILGIEINIYLQGANLDDFKYKFR
jgi:hypothetical protein